ncbi:MAG: zinc-finger domain-containing protein [Pseudomonadota bacterium]
MAAHEEFYLVDDREVVVTDAWHVACDGGGGALGHPVEYMTLEKGGEVVCKYCGRRYVHESHEAAARVRAEGVPYQPSVAA